MIVLMTERQMTEFLGRYGYRVEPTKDSLKRFRVAQKTTGNLVGTFSLFELEVLCQGVYIAWTHLTNSLSTLRPPE